jgi:hypothetical protein
MQDLTQTIVAFLTEIGISVREDVVATDSFLPGLCIRQGSLVYDRETLRWPGDLLHEAGHIATIPASMRAMLSDSLDESPDVSHAGEVEATAWAYAATVHMGLAASVLFHPEGYDGRSEQLIITYTHGVHPGCFGLSQAGMTLLAADAISASARPYPHMTKWLRD